MGQLFPYSFTPYKPLGFGSEVVSTSTPAELTLPTDTRGALVQASGGVLHWTNDGTAPTSAAGGGMVIAADAEPQWFAANDLELLKFIAAAANTYLLVSFYG